MINIREKIIGMKGYSSFSESVTNPGFKRKEHWPGSLDLSPNPGSVVGLLCPLRPVLSPFMPQGCYIYQTESLMFAHPASQSCCEAVVATGSSRDRRGQQGRIWKKHEAPQRAATCFLERQKCLCSQYGVFTPCQAHGGLEGDSKKCQGQ